MEKNRNLIMLGDSITNGFDGHQNLTQNISYYLSEFNHHLNITNAGVNAGTICGHSERDLTYQVDNHNFANYQLATIFYGTNDFAHREETLEVLGRILQKNIDIIMEENPKIKIYGILPINRFDGGSDNYYVSGLAQYTFGELLTKLTAIYAKNQIPVLNWRLLSPDLLTNQNYLARMGDQRLHPNSNTYQKMAEILNKFIIKN